MNQEVIPHQSQPSIPPMQSSELVTPPAYIGPETQVNRPSALVNALEYACMQHMHIGTRLFRILATLN